MESKIENVYALCFAKDMGIAVEIQGVRTCKGNGNIILTGNVGELARDSVYVCKTLLQLRNLNILNSDYHLHFQYLQLRKDGPSWGLACFIILCLLSGTKIKYSDGRSIAATGELDLYGNVKTVAYLDEKIEAAINNEKSRTIILPKTNFSIPVANKEIHQINHINEILV